MKKFISIMLIFLLTIFLFNKNIVLANNSYPKLWEKQWDMQKITNNGESYKISEGTHNTTVGIIDSGINKQHPD